MNKQVVLARRPVGKPVADDFAMRTVEMARPRANEAVVKNLYVSLDAGFRNWMDEDAGDEVLPAMAIGAPVMGLTMSEVIESRHPGLPVGQLLMGRLAWETYSIASDADFLVPIADDHSTPIRYHLGILGDTGMSAYFGMKDIAAPKPGDTVLVSAAAGAVGYVACQVARILGAGRVVGITGDDRKAERLVRDVGVDAVVNYRRGDVDAQLASTCPDGIDIYFDNVGGPLLEPVLNHINVGARIPFCGAVADYTRTEPVGPSNLFQLVTRSARLEGFMTHTRVDRYDEARNALRGWLDAGRLKCFEHRYQGIENCGVAFADLFAGRNFGKTIVKV